MEKLKPKLTALDNRFYKLYDEINVLKKYIKANKRKIYFKGKVKELSDE